MNVLEVVSAVVGALIVGILIDLIILGLTIVQW